MLLSLFPFSDNITTALVLTWAVWLFQKYLLNKNWRHTQYVASGAMALLGLMWLIPIFDLGGLRNAWFTIFINTNQVWGEGFNVRPADK